MLQLFHDLRLCWLLGNCPSTACCSKGFFYNTSSWEDEAGTFPAFRRLSLYGCCYCTIPTDSAASRYLFCLLDCEGESISFIYISFEWHSSLYWCCSSWTRHSWCWLYNTGSFVPFLLLNIPFVPCEDLWFGWLFALWIWEFTVASIDLCGLAFSYFVS